MKIQSVTLFGKTSAGDRRAGDHAGGERPSQDRTQVRDATARRNPEANPAEIITTLERHYVTAITISGGVMSAGTIAANVGLALIPGVAAGKEAGKGAAKVAAKKCSQDGCGQGRR